MPATSREILDQLNAPARVVPEALSNDILGGHHLGKAAYLFTKIEEKKADEWRVKFGGAQAAAAAPAVKKKVKKAAAAKVAEGPKTEEIIALEAQIKSQGDTVRDLKTKQAAAGEGGTPTLDDVDIAVKELLRLKSSLAEAQEKEAAKAAPAS